jgi:hypothetical protein
MLRVSRIDPEIKYFDTQWTGTIPSTGTIYPLSNILGTSGPSGRDGNVVHPIKIVVRAQLGMSTVVTPLAECIRIIIFRALYDASTVTPSRVVQDASAGAGIISAYNREYQGQSKEDCRMEILFDSINVFNTQGVNGKVHTFESRCDDLIRFNANTSFPDPLYGGYYVYMTSQGTGPASFNVYTRVDYIDA